MDVEGRIHFRLTLDHDRVAEVDIRSNRLLDAVRVFHGRTPEETLELLPRLYSVCGTAQAVAAVRAMEAALYLPGDEETEAAREALVRLETLREHLWHIFLKWPVFLGETPMREEAAEVHRICRRAISGSMNDGSPLLPGARAGLDATVRECRQALHPLVTEKVLGQTPSAWLENGEVAVLVGWAGQERTMPARLVSKVMEKGWSAAGLSRTPFLPVLDGPRLAKELGDGRFIAFPSWRGSCRETGSLARTHTPLLEALERRWGRGLLLRLVARLSEVARLLLESDPPADPGHCRPTKGLGQVEAARGRLFHQVELERGRIARYRILAPTEWNFHPQGVVAESLGALQGSSNEIEQQARMLVDAIDPCVGYDLEVV